MKVLEKNYFWLLLPLLHLLASGAEHEEVAKHAIKLHRGKGATVSHRKQWVLDGCRKLSGLLRQKAVVLNKLKNAIRAVEKDVGLSDEEKLFQVHTFEIFQKELNESENSVFQAIHGLQRALQGDYKDVVNMKESSRQRLEALREAAIKEETEYVELLAAEKHQVEALKNMQHQNKSLSMLDEILEDVRKAADRLEEEIEEHAFDDNKSVKGVNFEAVLRVEEEEANSKQNLTKREVEDDLGLSMLIDSQNNQYILTKPRDATIPRADHHFIKDIVTIGMLSLPCGWLCTTIGLPTMFGYIICGVLLGPSGLNSIKSIVQVETLGEFGVFFTLFLVGLEFSPEKLRKVWKISLQGPCYMTLLMIAFGLLWGHLLQIRATQSVFISTCLSLSSTPLVSRFLVGSARGEKEGHGAAGRFHGAGLLPGRSAYLFPRPHGHRGDCVLHRAYSRLPGNHFFRIHRASRVSHLRGVRAHHPHGPHFVGGRHEVCSGCTGLVSPLAENQPVHQVDRGCRAGAGQRVLFRPGEQSAQSGHHLSGGVPPHPECDHAQSFIGPRAMESCNYQVCATARPAVKSLKAPR
ncbi:transmembrane and coiled-coil domain-containing protein 3 isoform X3 [Sturnira hondurensis]|uniref:transmembrane and coiled-coil domain-containing protein 3 isoform X3 n=1 Tax=Sturnira hondurensis TaxID=192404 RepID=UPI00187970B1|nr:transmembrane and coiled-coil domain-containing protein 3 isoform X3 [Sturnira hondurensis]